MIDVATLRRDAAPTPPSAGSPWLTPPPPPPARPVIDRAVPTWWVRLGRFVAVLGCLFLAGVFLVTPDGTGVLQPLDTAFTPAHPAPGWLRTIVVFGSSAVPLLTVLVAVLEIRPVGRRTFTVIAAAGITWISAWAVAAAVRRPVPGAAGIGGGLAIDWAFPSIAGAMTAAVAIVLLRQMPQRDRLWQAVAGVGVVGLALLRIASGTAWLLDEVAGVVLATATVHLLLPRPTPVRRVSAYRAVRVAAAVTVAGLALPAGVGYARYLTAPGSATIAERSIEYLRDHGLSPMVDRAEAWWLWSHLPSTGGRLDQLPAAPLSVPGGGGLPAALRPAITPSLTGEGVWTVASSDPSGRAQIATTVIRPDPQHPTLTAGIAWVNHATTRLQLIAGTREPGGGSGPSRSMIPPSLQSTVLAAFNSGYRMKDTPGGALVEGRRVRTMQAGLATVAIRADGTSTVGAWGTDIDPNGDYVALRQNLHLMVVGGRVVDGVAVNAGRRWGTIANALPTWRSGIGATAAGDLVYVAGDQLTLGVLADTLARAGAVTGMELDIHNGMVTFNLFSHSGSGVQGHKLLPDMTKSAGRYLVPDWRDFFVVAPAPST